MQDYILFINSQTDARVATEVFQDNIDLVKIRINDLKSIRPLISKSRLWIDIAFDGYPVDNDDSPWNKFFKTFSNHHFFTSKDFLIKPNEKIVSAHIYEILDSILHYAPAAISVPQLEYTDINYNKLNKMICKSFSNWKSERNFTGDVILPVIFKHQRAIGTGVEKTKRFKTLEVNYATSNANSIWVVDASLQDQLGTGNFEDTRFPALIELHNKIKTILSPKIHVAGPYWGLNILLWARGAIKNPAFAIGNGFQHYSPGGVFSTPSAEKMALPPLYRLTKATSDLKIWLNESSVKLEKTLDGKSFKDLSDEYEKLKVNTKFKEQVTVFYLAWFNKYKDLPENGRALALYQDLSNAYIIGKNLEDMPNEKGTTRKPGIVAKQLMMNCL